MNRVRISVAMCTYNGEAYLRDQLVSILDQTYAPHELVICDDSSTDNTNALLINLTSRADFPVKIFRQESNVGVNKNFATAISMCSGEYIALADQDDIWDRRKLQVFADEILKFGDSRPSLLYSDIRLINGENSPLRRRFSPGCRVFQNENNASLKLPFGNFIPGCSMLFDSRYVKEILPIPPQAILHDWWIALLISLRGNLVYIDKELIAYRVHENNNQGINSFKRTISMVRKFGLVGISRNNFLLSLRQLQAASDRLRQHGQPVPDRIAAICEMEKGGRFFRLVTLLKSGVRRGSALLGCLLIKSGQPVDDHMRYL